LEHTDDFQLVTGEAGYTKAAGHNFLLDATKTIDCYLSKASMSGSLLSKWLLEVFAIASKKRGVRVRIITTVNAENIEIAKQFARHFDMYHIDETEGNFCIIDSSLYLCNTESSNNQTTDQSNRQLLSKHISFVKLQQSLFQNLLNHAIPVRDKIKEVERGMQREYVQAIHDSSSISHIVKERIETAGFDVQALFASINSFYWAEDQEIVDLLGDASSRGVNVRVLIKIDDDTLKDVSKNKIKQRHDRINVNFIHQPLKSKITTFIIDQSFSLTIDVNDDINFSRSTDLATYSNSESRVFADYSMFENLWIQAERERHHSIRQAYFEMFSGRKLKDEVYEKDWTSNEK
jgi:sugar-specific transcriptional regulator TrmB